MNLISFSQIAGGNNLVNQVNELANNLSSFESRLEAIKAMNTLLEERKTLTNEDEVFFDLEEEPNDNTIKLLINGVIYEENDSFTCDRSTKTVTWTFTSSNDGFDLNSDLAEHITIYYYSGFSVSSSSALKLLRADKLPITGDFTEGDIILKIHPISSENIGWIYTSQDEWMEIGIADFKNTIKISTSAE